jgi:hypothetical protein
MNRSIDRLNILLCSARTLSVVFIETQLIIEEVTKKLDKNARNQKTRGTLLPKSGTLQITDHKSSS